MSVTLNELFESKVHIGHLPRYWNPEMRRFIFGIKNGMHQIDLDQSQSYLQKALDFLRELGTRRGSKVLFVGTKPVAQSAIKEQAVRCGMPYVDKYWRGGNLTNYRVTSGSGKKLKYIEAEKQQENFGKDRTKKEMRKFEHMLAYLEKGVGGIKNMVGLPDALFVIDVGVEKIAVSEALKLRIPVIGIVDTNHSPKGIDYFIPGNDDSSSAISLYTRRAADAILEGRQSISEISMEEATPQPVIKRVKKSTLDSASVSGEASKP